MTLQIVIVENEFLSLIPGQAAPEVTTVPLVRLRDIPAFLRRRSCLHSLSSLLDQNEISRNENLSIIEMKKGVLQDLMERQSLRTGHSSFCIPGSAPVQIIATGKEHTYLMRCGEMHVQISHTCGYWTSDFCGVGGFQQVLWLPNINMNLEEWSYPLAERILAQVLYQGALTDGVDSYLSRYIRIEQCSTPFMDACPDIILCSVSEIADSDDEPMELPTADDESKRPVSTSGGKQSSWRKKMTRALESRLIQQRKEHDKRVLTQQVKRLMLKRNLEALQDHLNPEVTSLQVARIRYRTLSRGKGAVVIFLEVDVAAVGESPAFSGLHLSCSPMSTKDDNISVRTQSGIIPELMKGMCVTIMLIVEIDGIVFSDNCRQFPLLLNIEAHWTSLTARRALNLTTLDLPMELLLSIQSKMTTVEYSRDHLPSAAYECRQPLRLVVDVSYCFPRDWNAWVEEFNGLLKGSGHRIDLCDGYDGTATLSLLLFACPKEEVPGLVTLIKYRLPELAKVINAVDHQ